MKPSTILIAKQHGLENMPEHDRAAVRRFLFDAVRGLDEQNDRRWKRFWKRIWDGEPGEVFHIDSLVERSGPYHRMHMAVEQALFDRQDRFTNPSRFRDWLKTGAGFGTYAMVGDRMRFVPATTKYEDCSDDEMREFHDSMLVFLRTPHAQRFLWRHLTSQQRSEMVESLLDPSSPTTN